MRRKSEFGRPLVNSCLTLSIVVGMSVSDVSQKAIGNLGWTDIRLTAPVFVGDTIYAESPKCWRSANRSRVRRQGIVTVRTTGRKSRRHRLHHASSAPCWCRSAATRWTTAPNTDYSAGTALRDRGFAVLLERPVAGQARAAARRTPASGRGRTASRRSCRRTPRRPWRGASRRRRRPRSPAAARP